tara:strand:- start:598 stop:1242 length:645 start_codon:yes stop_codon:yes gene_type:complete
MIKHTYLDHSGGMYYYRIHGGKVGELCDERLQVFLHQMFSLCPNDYFQGGPRSSSLKFNISGLDIKHVKGHEVSLMAKQGLWVNFERFNDNHSRVQVFMLEGDSKTIAMEVPIWLKEDEMGNFNELFGTNDPLSGHIDLVRVEDGLIWIWDYKPGAKKEKYASTQVAFYAYMLSKRTGVPLEKFRCGYFDAEDAYVFKPVDSIERVDGVLNRFS